MGPESSLDASGLTFADASGLACSVDCLPFFQGVACTFHEELFKHTHS